MSQSLALETKRDVAGVWSVLRRLAFPHASLWLLSVGIALLNFALAGLSPRISLDPLYSTILLLFYGFAAALIVARFAGERLFDWFLHRVWGTFMCLLLMISFTSNLGVLNFLVMTQQWPFADATLIAGDKLVGFDWLAYSMFLTDAEWSRRWLFTFYHEITRVGMFALPLLGLLLSNRLRTYETMFMILVTGIICVIVSGFFPALGPWTLLADKQLLDRIAWSAPINYLDMMYYLRGSGDIHIDLSQLIGLSSCPSYHTCLGLSFIVATRGYRGLNVLGLIACIGILLATPIYGTHYITDVIAGVVTTAFTFYIWQRFVKPRLHSTLAAADDKTFDFPKAIMNLRFGKAAAKRQA